MHAETIVSASCEAAGKNRRANATPASPATNETSRISEQRQGQRRHKQKSRSGTTDEVIDLDNSNEAISDTISAPTTLSRRSAHNRQGAISRNQAGVKRPAPATPLGDTDEQNNPPIKPKTTTNMEVVEEGGSPVWQPSCAFQQSGHHHRLSRGTEKTQSMGSETSCSLCSSAARGRPRKSIYRQLNYSNQFGSRQI